MKPASRKISLIAVFMIALIAALILLFRVIYEPQLALRKLQRSEEADPNEMERLLQISGENKFDLTDTLQLAGMIEAEGSEDEALALFENLVKRYPGAPVIKLWYAERLQQYSRWNEAEIQYLALLVEIGENSHSTEDRARKIWRAGEKDIAVARRVAKIPQDLAGVSGEYVNIRLAENAMAAGMASSGADRAQWFDKSSSYFKECLKLDPDNHTVRGRYSNLLLQMERPAESLLNYQLLLETDPNNVGWLISAAIAAGANRQFDLAERYIRGALRIENRPEWRLELARFMSWGGKHDAALGEITALIEEQPGSQTFRQEHAQLLLNAGRHSEYLNNTARLAAADPLNLNLRLNRIRAMTGLRLYREAANEAAAALALFPDNREAAMLKAEALLWNNDYAAAQADLLLLTSAHPDDRTTRKRLAQSYLWDRRYADALRIFRTLRPESLDDFEAAQGFAEAVAGAGKPVADDAERIRAMHSAVTRRPSGDYPATMLSAIGRALREIGDNDAAVELLRDASQKAQANLVLRLELADLLESIGRHKEAGEQYRIITESQNMRKQ